MVPPPLGCGWQMRAEQGAALSPSLSRASSLPAGPGMNKLRKAPFPARCAGPAEIGVAIIPQIILRADLFWNTRRFHIEVNRSFPMRRRRFGGSGGLEQAAYRMVPAHAS